METFTTMFGGPGTANTTQPLADAPANTDNDTEFVSPEPDARQSRPTETERPLISLPVDAPMEADERHSRLSPAIVGQVQVQAPTVPLPDSIANTGLPGLPGPTVASRRILPKSEHQALAKYLRGLLDIEETDKKAKTFQICFERYKLANSLREKLELKGWKVKWKEWEWWIPAGMYLFV